MDGANTLDETTDIDLTREAAHNLVLIYKASGAVGLAKATMQRYLVI